MCIHIEFDLNLNFAVIRQAAGLMACPEPSIAHLTSASTVSDDSAGDGAMTTSASPSNTNSHSIWMWKKTG